MKASPAAVYRTKPAALIVKPHAVYHFRWLLDLWAAGVIDHDTLSQFVSDEIQRGSIRHAGESVPVELTGRRNGSLVEYSMQGIAGEWWSIEDDIIG